MFETNDGSYLLLNYAIRHMEEVVRNIMTREVITIEENRTVRDAAELMTANQISSLIVEKNQNAIGIISERDFVRKICLCAS
jgi:CBS domain-containing protein